jgi:hypothetical protein
LPINIKSTTTTSADNTGNLAMCLYSYTNEPMDFKKSYQNGGVSKLLFNKLKEKAYNKNNKRDYYFLVVNKTDCKDVIVNSVKGLEALTPNVNNLPFQVCWNKNRNFKYDKFKYKLELFINALKSPKPSWKETFMLNIRTIKI